MVGHGGVYLDSRLFQTLTGGWPGRERANTHNNTTQQRGIPRKKVLAFGISTSDQHRTAKTAPGYPIAATGMGAWEREKVAVRLLEAFGCCSGEAGRPGRQLQSRSDGSFFCGSDIPEILENGLEWARWGR